MIKLEVKKCKTKSYTPVSLPESVRTWAAVEAADKTEQT